MDRMEMLQGGPVVQTRDGVRSRIRSMSLADLMLLMARFHCGTIAELERVLHHPRRRPKKAERVGHSPRRKKQKDLID